MPKRAIVRRTNSVKGGPRSAGGGTRSNGWNCGVIMLYGPGLLVALGAAALWIKGVS